MTDTSTNGTFVNKATEAPHKGQEVELHDGDTLSIGSYEIRVSRETAQPQPAASVAPLTGGRPEFESYAQTPSGGAVPDIMDLVGGTSTATNPFSSPAAKQETPDPAGVSCFAAGEENGLVAVDVPPTRSMISGTAPPDGVCA